MELPTRYGGEVRRVRVIYFLCRNGVVEQPHLIRLHHLHRSGVHLRDVKRWLHELRGRETGESLAWSYKRKYKTGFVWQDLKDDDLITPISDNEYVLKGSELPYEHNNPLFERLSSDSKTPESDSDLESDMEVAHRLILQSENLQFNRNDSISLYPPPGEDKSPRPLSSVSDASKQMVVLKINAWKQNEARVHSEKKRRKEQEEEKHGACLGGKNGSCTGKRASNVFHNLMKPCREVNTDDSVRSASHRRHREVSGETWSPRRSFESRQNKSMNGGKNKRVVSAVYKPTGEPNCSQCGKSFNPEKMHSHMKSCKALRRSRKD